MGYGQIPYPIWLFISVAAATAATTAAVAEEEQYKANSDDYPNVFAIKKVTQAVHTKPPFREKRFFLSLISYYADKCVL